MKQNILYTYFIILVISFLSFVNVKAQTYGIETFKILGKLDSLYQLDSIHGRTRYLESIAIGEAGTLSEKYKLYRKLLEVSNSHELYKIVKDPTLKPEIRGYGYMAYAYHVDSLGLTEKSISQGFKLNVLVGCRGYNQITFQTFKNIARKRGLNNPYPRKTLIDSEETKVIEIENQLRDEQGIPIRK